MKFKSLYEQTKEDVELSLLSLWTPGLHRMRPAIKDLLQREPLMAEPVFQSMFPWELTKDSKWQSYLDPQVIRECEIGKDFEPRQLQTDSWKELADGNSIVVTSGTGSGKTECFLYPILSDLYSRKVQQQNGNDPVGAIFLYPLNALMQDQKKRLGEYCEKLKLKFAVYNSSLETYMARVRSEFPNAEVMTRERVRNRDNNLSCPQILLTNPSMLEYILVRDEDKPIFGRSQGALRWIVIDEAHTYTGSAAVELAYLIKRVLQAFGVTRDQVRFVCTSATIGDPKKPQELIDFITSIIGDYSSPTVGKKLVPIDGKRIVASLTPAQIQAELDARGITETTGTQVEKFRNCLNVEPMTLSYIWGMLTGKNWTNADTTDALGLLDKLCDIKIGNDCLLMARGHFFMRNIDGLYACVNTQCTGRDHLSHLGFDYLTTYKGNGKCPHCGAPLLEVVQCGDCKEFLLACEENDEREIRPTHNDRWSSVGDKNEDTPEETDEEETDGGTIIDDTWERQYLAFYDDKRPYGKPHPNRYDSWIAFKWDGNALKTDSNVDNRPWVILQDNRNNSNTYYCPTCASGSGEDGHRFSRFHSPSNWLNGVLAPSLLKESVPAGANVEWGTYIAFTDSRQGTAIYAKRFNVDAERAYARARIIDELSNTLLNYTMRQTAICIFNQDMFDHIDYEISKGVSTRQHIKSEEGYKSALLRGIVGRKPVHVANMENLGLVTICYPAIDAMKPRNLPNACQTMGIALQDWKDFLKICLDYYVRMGNHLQCVSYEEKNYMRDSDRSTPFETWPSVKVLQGGQPSLRQHRLVILLCAGLGIHDVATLQQRKADVDGLLNEAYEFLGREVLSIVDVNDAYCQVQNQNYNGWYYLDMSLTSDKCTVKLTEEAWLCPVTNFLLDTTFKGYSPAIKGCLCPENIQRFVVDVNSQKIRIPHRNAQSYNSDLINFKAHGLWNDRIKYALEGTKTGYLTAEHSGQQDRTILDYYTKEFRAHKLNLLQCSTTMEMGVDIGDIELVLMTNVPPSSANYMQRAGRAGRRGQSRACAFSICPNTAIGADAFQNPSKSLTGITPAIKPVESEIIVERHANSFFVRQFLLANTNVEFHKVHSWLEAGGAGDSYANWLRNNSTNAVMQREFDKIFGSARTMSQYITNSINVLQSIQREYQTTYNDIANAFNTAQQNGKRAKAKAHALGNQLFALESQDLKGYLAENRFLPNADMPTGVVEFNHMDSTTAKELDEKKRKRDNKQNQMSSVPAGRQQKLKEEIDELVDKIDKILRKSITTREIKIALSEFAPGQTLVIDEKNYVSAGIDWKNRFGQANPYKYLYHCDNCGRFEYTDNSTLQTCANCNAPLRNVLFPRSPQPYTVAIEPVKFRTDVNEDATRQERTKKISFNIKTILTNVDWGNSVSGPLCDIVGNDDANGEIVFYNPGRGKGKGFSLCLDCRRMKETPNEPLTGATWPHTRINVQDSAGCPANNVSNNIVLSGKFPTSFVAMKFYEDSSRNQVVTDEELLCSLGVLLCRALANTIGISRNDIDFDVRKERGFSSIFIYDTTKGGCGYSTRMLDQHICRSVFREAKKLLTSFNCTCEDHVSGACVNCLVDSYSQRLENSLSKHKVMAWFAGQTMTLVNSASSTAITIPLPFLAIQKVNDKNTRSLTFCVDASDMRLAEWSQKSGKIGQIIDVAVSKGIMVNIVVANVPSVAKGAKLEDLIPFVDLPQKFQNWGVNVTAVKTLEVNKGEFSSMIVNDKEHFFTDQPNVLPFTENWGVRCTNLYENHVVPSFVSASFPTHQDISVNHLDEFINEYVYDGNPPQMTVRGLFSNIILTHLLKQGEDDILKSILSGQDVEISFNDSYVNSALASLILVYLLRGFRNHYKFNIAKINLQLQSDKRNCENYKWNNNTFITHNFPNEQEADNYTKRLCEDVLDVTPTFSEVTPDHCRWIRFKPRNGNRYVEFRPDHGIDGGWESPSRYFDLDWLDGTTRINSKRMKTVFYLLVKKK